MGDLFGLLDRFINETVEERLERVCGNDQVCRFAAGFYTPLFNRLEQRREFNESARTWNDQALKIEQPAMAS